MIRITADIDGCLISIAKIRTKIIIDYLFNKHKIIFDNIIYRKSSSGKGVHVILWTQNKLSKLQIKYIRMLLGDDYKRLNRDLKRKRARQFLFKYKNIHKEGIKLRKNSILNNN